jgi:hypothetical protein
MPPEWVHVKDVGFTTDPPAGRSDYSAQVSIGPGILLPMLLPENAPARALEGSDWEDCRYFRRMSLLANGLS